MKLKFKPLNLESGRPIAFINSNFAEKASIFEGSRIEVLYKKKKMTLPVNLIKKIIKENEVSFSNEATSFLRIRKGSRVSISSALQPESIRLIFKKLNKNELKKSEIFAIIRDIVNNALNEAEIAYFVSGVFHNGMTDREIIYLTEAMARTGRIISWEKGKRIADKHSIGGIPGNRTTPIVVSICAAAGIIIPKTSSRAITSAAGTADVVEAVANVKLPVGKLRSVVRKTNASLAWGGSLGLAPSDDKLIRVERMLNLDPEPQLIASILSKKLAVGSKYVLLDIPFGESAKVSKRRAQNLKKRFMKIGKHFGLKLKIVLTDGTQPIGNGIGPVLEMQEVFKVLRRENPSRDLEEKSIFLASEILEMMGRAKKGGGKALAQQILDSGRAFEKFNEIISAQGRVKGKLVLGKFSRTIKAKKTGRIKSVDNRLVSSLAIILGCPSNKGAGIYIHKRKDDEIKKGDPLLTLYSEVKKKLEESVRFYRKNALMEIS